MFRVMSPSSIADIATNEWFSLPFCKPEIEHRGGRKYLSYLFGKIARLSLAYLVFPFITKAPAWRASISRTPADTPPRPEAVSEDRLSTGCRCSLTVLSPSAVDHEDGTVGGKPVRQGYAARDPPFAAPVVPYPLFPREGALL
jgi:hypothetical protein